MKLLEELRRIFGNRPFSVDSSTVLSIADEIEREIAEHYMELPVDADGVPIHVGDVVAAQDEQPFEVRAFQLDELGWFAIERLGSQWHVNQLHHVKPRTLFDVLAEVENGELSIDDAAAEIRELIRVDA